jgi:hypothetical protein
LNAPLSALALFVLGVLADHHDAAFALDDLAFFADFLHRRSDFHKMTILSLSLGCFALPGRP